MLRGRKTVFDVQALATTLLSFTEFRTRDPKRCSRCGFRSGAVSPAPCFKPADGLAADPEFVVVVAARRWSGGWEVIRNHWDRFYSRHASQKHRIERCLGRFRASRPMGPGLFSDRPGKCGICNWGDARRKRRPTPRRKPTGSSRTGNIFCSAVPDSIWPESRSSRPSVSLSVPCADSLNCPEARRRAQGPAPTVRLKIATRKDPGIALGQTADVLLPRSLGWRSDDRVLWVM